MSYQSAHGPEAGIVSSPSQPVHDARSLTGGEGTAFIVLDDKTYTLRITRAGKLILTK